MAVEAATKISELNPLWPLGTDPKSEGDQHLRLLKSVLQSTTGGALSDINLLVKTTSGTYTKPTGLKLLEVWTVGGGGDGANLTVSIASNAKVSGGGGGGGVAAIVLKAADLASSQAYTVGSGGGTSIFAATLQGGGGANGTASANSPAAATAAGGAAGSGTGGTLNLSGQRGGYGVANAHGIALQYCGDGGGNFFASPSTGKYIGSGVGTAGNFPGGGGSGCGTRNVDGAMTGGAGAAGCIILKEHF